MAITTGAGGGIIKASLLAFASLAISISSVSLASAAEIVDRGSPPPKVLKVRTGPAQVVSESYSVPAGSGDFWTPARMASAKPVAMPDPGRSFDLPSFGGGASISAATGDFTPGNVTAFPQRVHGKVFFRIGSETFTCSGTVIESATRNVVATAGHCVYDVATKTEVEEMVFVPAYENNSAPLGIFHVTETFTTPQWAANGNSVYDIATLTLDQPIQNSLGARKIAFDLDPRGKDYTLLGYPSRPSPRFDGEILQGCRSRVIGQDNGKGSVVRFPVYDKNKRLIPFPLAARPCYMQQGASGGGWVTLGNYVNSVVSYGYCDTSPDACGVIFGPYFSNAAMSLYKEAGGSPAPTVKLVKAPPKVIRKRQARFRFSGTAATLVGFSCKLDRQKAVGCSSKISIRNLRPGKHVLRVRAVDQTGKMSKRQIVRKFRVVLKKKRR